MKFIDDILNTITMYRLVLYFLLYLLFVAFVYSIFGILPFNPLLLVISASLLTAICWVTNKLFSYVYTVPTNVESVYITALILSLIISPIKSFSDLPLYFFAGVLSIASKYILTIHKKHIFNPVAIAVVLTAIGFNGSASWWIGTMPMLPFVLLGFLIVRKIRRFDLVFYFFIATLLTILGFSVVNGSNILLVLKETILSTALCFFAFVMLTEPLTTPPTKKLQAIYGIIVGILFAPQFHIGSFYTTPELALIAGNIYAYFVSPKFKIFSTLQQKIRLAPDIFEFLFLPSKKLAFSPGQYMEWTFAHKHTDSRGNRRYFTIASSPTEDEIKLGVKFYQNGSSYKKAMLLMDNKTPIIGAQLSGDFTLPKDSSKKLVFIAGGIGITPFRSMIKYLLDTKEKRTITLLYSNKTQDEIVYSDIFTMAQKELGIKVIYTLTDTKAVLTSWAGRLGRIDQNMITQEIPDYKDRIFFLSGPHVMIDAYDQTLRSMGISEKQIKKDFFPGFV